MIRTMKRNVSFWLTMVFLLVVIAVPAFAQMQGSTLYSDSWGDDNYVYGHGVTDEPYNTYNHTFRAVTTITSPLGRNSSYDSGYGDGVAFVSLSFDENDLGVYYVTTDHYDYCPIVLAASFIGSTTVTALSGITLVCYDYSSYRRSTNECVYRIQDDCPVTRCRITAYTRYKWPHPSNSCPIKVYVKYKWTESGPNCECNCVKTSDTPTYTPDDPTCVCKEFVSL